MKDGNVLIVAVFMVGIFVIILFFIATLFMNHVNSILYTFKLEMYSINKSAVFAVNKGRSSIDDFSYNKNVYKKYFENELKREYDLNKEFKNNEKLIKSVEILEYEIFSKKDKDTYTNKKCENQVIHTVIKLKIKPIIMSDFLENIFTFIIHEDVNLNELSVDNI